MRIRCDEQTESALKDLLKRLEARSSEFKQASGQRERIEAQLKTDEEAWQRSFAELNLADEKTTFFLREQRARLDFRRRHFEADFARRKLFDVFQREIEQAAPVIRAAAQPRHPAETFISKTHWTQRFGPLGTMPKENQYHQICDICRDVIQDLRTVLEAKRGWLLSAVERTTGRLVNPDGEMIRLLSREEQFSGYANE